MARRLPKNRDDQLAAIARVLDTTATWLDDLGDLAAPSPDHLTAGALRTYVESARLLSVLPQKQKRTSRAATVRPPRRSTVDTLERSLSDAGGRSR